MTLKQTLLKRFEFALPKFLYEDYSPYKCNVSANRENYNLRARKVHLQNMIKTWVNTGNNPFSNFVQCQDCLFDTRIPNIYIGPDGLCNMCMTYKQNFKPAILASEVETFMHTPRVPGSQVDAVVAFSGGKDSAISLYLAKEKYRLEVVAVLVENDFIPESVIENGRAFCNKLGVDLVVRHVDFAPHVKKMMDNKFKTGYPCYMCTGLFHKEIQDYCVQNHINRVILGRNWWRWLEPEVRAVRRVRDESGLDVQFLSLPFSLQLTEPWVRSTLSQIGWSPVEIHGNSTNCLIPGLVEYTIQQRIGYHPELNLLSREVIAGYITKEKATEELKHTRDLAPALKQLVREKLER